MAFENCKNCGHDISCGCEYKMASNGTYCCDSCIQAYELTLYKVKEELNNALIEPWGSLTAGLEEKIIKNNDELFNGVSTENDDEEPEVL